MINDNVYDDTVKIGKNSAEAAGVTNFMSLDDALKKAKGYSDNKFLALTNRDAAILAMRKKADTLFEDDNYSVEVARGDDEIEAIRAEIEDGDGTNAYLPDEYDGGVLRVIRFSGDVAAYALCYEKNNGVKVGYFSVRKTFRRKTRYPISTIPIDRQQFEIGFGHLLMSYIMTTGTSVKVDTNSQALKYIVACLGFSLDKKCDWVWNRQVS